MTDLRVSVGVPNGDGKRPVVYRLGDREYPDTVDVQSGWQREQSLRRARCVGVARPTICRALMQK